MGGALTTEDYIRLLPTEAPDDIYEIASVNWSEFRTGVLSYKAISFREAEGLSWCDDVVDFRKDRKDRPAELWCSQCDRKMIGRYIAAEYGCHGYGSSSGVEIEDGYYQRGETYQDGASMLCPCCGEQVQLKSVNAMRHGVGAQGIVAHCTVREGKVIFTEWLVERHIRIGKNFETVTPMRAYILDGKKWVKLAQYKKGYGSQLIWEGGWHRRSKMIDELGAPVLHPEQPCLDGTPLENAKLWEYKAQAYKDGNFLPIVYTKLYFKHNHIENLITAGFGQMVGRCLRDESYAMTGYYGGYHYGNAKLDWIDWKETKPSRMLHLTREELSAARDGEWNGKQIRMYAENKGHVSLQEMEEAFEKIPIYSLERILAEPLNRGKLGRIMRYMKKQGVGDYHTYTDYLNMAQTQGLDLTDEAVRWPARLRDAHDRLAIANRYKTTEVVREKFEDMTARCRGLNWKQGGIVIRVAETPEELVQEGKNLKHCVGGYAESHAKGNIILFIRHARRPERSWYTLNLNTKEKIIIQNHGYRNERLPNGQLIRIPQEVRQFVEDWKENVLAGWSLPIKRKGEIA